MDDGDADRERRFAGATGDGNGESEDGGVDFPFVDGVPAFAGAFQLVLQFGQGGGGLLGESDEIAWCPSRVRRPVSGVNSDSSAVPTAVTEAG